MAINELDEANECTSWQVDKVTVVTPRKSTQALLMNVTAMTDYVNGLDYTHKDLALAYLLGYVDARGGYFG